MANLGQVLFTLGNMNDAAYQSQLQQQNLARNQQALAANAAQMQAYQDQQVALGAYGKNFIEALTAAQPKSPDVGSMPPPQPPQPGQPSVPMTQPTAQQSAPLPSLQSSGLAPVQPIAGAMQQHAALTGTPTVAKGLTQQPGSAQAAPQPPQTPEQLTGSILQPDPTQPIPNPSIVTLNAALNGPLKPVMDMLTKAGESRPQDDPVLEASMTAWKKYLTDNPNATPGQLAAFTEVAMPQTMSLLKDYSAQTRLPLASMYSFVGALAKGVLNGEQAQQSNATKQYVADQGVKRAQISADAGITRAQLGAQVRQAKSVGQQPGDIPFAQAMFNVWNGSRYGKDQAANRNAAVQKAQDLGIPLPALQESISINETSRRALSDLTDRAALVRANEGAVQQQATIALNAAKNLGLSGPVSINAGKLFIGKKLVPTDSPIYKEVAQYDALLKEIQREYGSISMFGKSTVWGMKSSSELVNENAGAGLEGVVKGIAQGAQASISALENVRQGLQQAPVLTLIQNSKDPQKTAGEFGMQYLPKAQFQQMLKQKPQANPADVAMQLFLKGVYVQGMQYNQQ